MSEKTIIIHRFDPDKDDKPYMQTFTIDEKDIPGKMLLNALEGLRLIDPSLGFRRSCGEGVCGSDGMNINGKNGLACVTPLAALPNKIVLQPLPGFPVIRDLIVDMNQFYRHYSSVDPYLQNHAETPAIERLQSPKDREKLDGLYECIMCGCCSAACPSYWWNPEKYAGPAALLASYRFVADSRDTEKSARLEDLKDPYTLYRCRNIMNCTYVCPKGLNPTKAIEKLRHEMLDESL